MHFGIDRLTTDWFLSLPHYLQYPFWMVAMFGYRTTYFVAWTINDGAIACSGLSFSGIDEDKTAKFDQIVSVNIYKMETCTVPREGIRHWNSMTCEWLRHYVYERVRPKKGKDPVLATIGTNLVSALWHGFYPTYYNCFFLMAIVSEIGKDVYRVKHIFTFIPNQINGLLRNLLIITALNYCATGMAILEFEKAYQYYNNFYFFMHILLIGSFVLFRFFLVPM